MPTQPRWSARAPKGGIEKYKGGQFIPKSVIEYEKRVAANAFDALKGEFDKDLQFLRSVGQLLSNLKGLDVDIPAPLSKATVEDRAIRAIRSYYSRAFLLGKRSAGDLTSISMSDRSALKRVRSDEYKFLRKFLSDIDGQIGKIPYEKRASFYAHALREAYWMGFCMGDLSDQRRIYWHFGNTIEHCTDCTYFASRIGGWPIAEFYEEAVKQGRLPQSGTLECKGLFCECWLSDTPMTKGK